ncbi:MAG: hypothetical protein GY909_13350 [Oligoflexia bacterium]|nr:hypothetical protein [Oligoflexia bacterium]
MKTTSKKTLALSLVALFALSPSVIIAQDDLINDAQGVFNSDQIDIDGQFRKETAADRVAKMRKKLEEQNEQMVQKKIEDIRVRNEQKLANQLQGAFNGQQIDTVSTGQAAVQKVEVKAPEAPKAQEKKNKIIPSFGVTQFNGENIDGFESTINAGIQFENMITERIAVGLGVQYTTMEITDTNTINNFGNNFGFNNFNNFNNNQAEIDYKNLNLNVNGKFFLSADAKIKPFVGAALGYNRTTVEYTKKPTTFNNFCNGFNCNNNNDVPSASGSNISGTALIGAEVDFTDTVGLALDVRYTKAFTASMDPEGEQNQDERVLKSIGKELEESDQASLNLGFIIKF